MLADIIISKDEISGSATNAKVPGFIELIVKDMPSNQVPMRGGLRWLDMQCLKRFDKPFTDCSQQRHFHTTSLYKKRFSMQYGYAVE